MQQVLRVKIHQPSAHYRVPFSYVRRFTYPIPAYSTIKGLICNLMGITSDSDERFKRLKEQLSIAIYGKYEGLVKEYIWFRNLSQKAHIGRFNSPSNRVIDGTPQHPGGQMPVMIDVLENVKLIVYIYHPEILEEIESAFKNPVQRTSVIHLGRSEDWLVFEGIEVVSLTKSPARRIPYFTWIPSEESIDHNFLPSPSDYHTFFDGINANLFRLPTYYIIDNHNHRIFNEYLTVKLYEGGIFRGQEFYVDKELEYLPVILASLKGD